MRLRVIQAQVDSRLFQRFDKVKNIGRPAAGNGRDHVDVRLVTHPDHATDRAENALRAVPVGLIDGRSRKQSGHTRPDQRRGIGHHAHNASMTAQPARQIGRADAGSDADHQLPAQACAQILRHHAHLLRFHRQQYDVFGNFTVERGNCAHAELLLQAPARFLRYVNSAQIAGLEALLQQAADQCGGHVAAAYE